MRTVTFTVLVVPVLLAAQDSGTVEGRVTDTVTGYGLPGVAVEIRNRQKDFYQSTTDLRGAFRITGVNSGTYGWSLNKAGYQDSRKPTDGAITVRAAGTFVFNARMTPFSTLHGRVLDSEGKPAAKAHVLLTRGRVREAITDADGLFDFDELESGLYTLLAKPESKEESANDGPRVRAVNTFYASAIERSEAEWIHVRAGFDSGEHEIRLRTSPVYRLRGVVLDETGRPAPHATVKLLKPGGQGTQSYGSSEYTVIGPEVSREEDETVSTADGDFEFSSVRPGDWRIQAELDPALDPIERDVEPAGGISVSLSRFDIDALQIRLSAPFDLKYSVDWGQAEVPEYRRNSSGVLLRAVNGQPTGNPTGESGRFKDFSPGRYRVVPWSSGIKGSHVDSVFLGDLDVLGRDVNLAAGSPPLRIVYKPGAGSMRGIVERCAGATVVVLERPTQSPKAWSYIRTLNCGPNDTFEIGSIDPGDYYVWAFDRADTRELIIPAFVSTILSTAQSVHVGQGATASVQLRVNLWPE